MPRWRVDRWRRWRLHREVDIAPVAPPDDMLAEDLEKWESDVKSAVGDLVVNGYRPLFSPHEIPADAEAAFKDVPIGRPGSTVFIARYRGSIVGTVTVDSPPELYRTTVRADTRTTASVRRLAVHEDCQRLGLGELLARKALDHARAHGCTRVVLQSDQDMRAARALYERLGFRREPELDVDIPYEGRPRSFGYVYGRSGDESSDRAAVALYDTMTATIRAVYLEFYRANSFFLALATAVSIAIAGGWDLWQDLNWWRALIVPAFLLVCVLWWFTLWRHLGYIDETITNARDFERMLGLEGQYGRQGDRKRRSIKDPDSWFLVGPVVAAVAAVIVLVAPFHIGTTQP